MAQNVDLEVDKYKTGDYYESRIVLCDSSVTVDVLYCAQKETKNKTDKK